MENLCQGHHNPDPTILFLLFIEPEKCIQIRGSGRALQELAPLIVSRGAGGAFLGYLQAQRQRMQHERGGRHRELNY